MTQPADPTIFQRTTPAGPRTITPTQVATTTTRKNADGSTDVIDQNGNIVSHTPAPAPAATPGPTPATYPVSPVIQNPDGSTSNGAVTSGGAVVKVYDPNDPTTYTTRTNADGSVDTLDSRGVVVKSTGTPGGTPTGSFGGPNAGGPGVLDLSGSTTPAPPHPATAEEQADIDAYEKEILAANQQIIAATNKLPTQQQMFDIIANAQQHHPLAAKYNSTVADLGSTSNNQLLVNRTVAAAAADTARITQAGALGQQQLTAAGQIAATTGQAGYSQALADAEAARNAGSAGLSTALGQGYNTTLTAQAAANPLTNVANVDLANGQGARIQATDSINQTNASLSAAQQQVQRLQQLAAAGDPAAVAQLQSFQGSGGTSGALIGANTTAGATGALGGFQGSSGTADALNSMPTGVEATNRLGQVAPSTGDASRLEGLGTAAGATSLLGQFAGSAGTAGALDNLDTSLGSTRLASSFAAAPGESTQLAKVLNTNASATGALGNFLSTPGEATALAGLDTHTEASDALGDFSAGGGSDLATLQRIANGGDIGPSAAEALLRKNNDETLAQNIAIARSGRGAGSTASNLRSAIFTNAAQGQKLGNDVAALRAEEAATARGQNITAATSAAGTATTQSAQALDALKTKQTAETASTQQRLEALVASGQMTQAQAAQQLDALKSKQQGELASIAQKSSNVVAAGQQEQTASQQQLDAIKVTQAGDIATLTNKLNALVASGQMTQAQANQQLSALQSQQQGQLASIAQQSTNLATAGQQRQVASAQQIDALKAQQQGELQAESDRIQALVAAGQMSQTQAAQRLDALKSQQQGQLASIAQTGTNLANAGQQQQTQAQQQLSALQAAATGQTAAANTRVAAATAAGSTANQSAATSADIAKTFANLGLNYDVNSGNVLNNAGQIVMTGQQVQAQLTNTGLSNQAAEGANAANITSSGLQTLTNLTNASVDAQKATAVLGVQVAGAITSLSQAELSQLAQIVSTQNAGALQKFALDNQMAIALNGQDIQQQAAVFGAIGSLITGVATLGASTLAKA